MSSSSDNYPSSSSSNPPGGNAGTGSGSIPILGPWPSYSSGSSSNGTSSGGTNSSSPSSSSPSSGSSGSSSLGSSSSLSGSSGSSSGNSSDSGGSSSSSSSGSGSNWNYRMNIIVPTATGTVKANRYSQVSVQFKDLIQIDKFQKSCSLYNNQFFLDDSFASNLTPSDVFNDIQPLRIYGGDNTNNGIIQYYYFYLLAYSFSGTAIEGVDYIVNSEYYDPIKKVHSEYYDHAKRMGIIYDLVSQLKDNIVILPYRQPYVPERTIKIDFKFMLLCLGADMSNIIWNNWDMSDISIYPYAGTMNQFGTEEWYILNDASHSPMHYMNEYHIETPDFHSWPKFPYSEGDGSLTENEITYLDSVLAGKGTTITILEPDPVLKCALAQQSKSNIKLNETTVIQVSHDGSARQDDLGFCLKFSSNSGNAVLGTDYTVTGPFLNANCTGTPLTVGTPCNCPGTGIYYSKLPGNQSTVYYKIQCLFAGTNGNTKQVGIEINQIHPTDSSPWEQEGYVTLLLGDPNRFPIINSLPPTTHSIAIYGANPT